MERTAALVAGTPMISHPQLAACDEGCHSLPVEAGAGRCEVDDDAGAVATNAGGRDSEPTARLPAEPEEDRELLAEFHAETVDHLRQIEGALLALHREPDNREALNAIFRSFHSIKGNAGFFGLEPMCSLAHEVESLLDLARSGKLRLDAAIVTDLFQHRDALQVMTQQVAVGLSHGRPPSEMIPPRSPARPSPRRGAAKSAAPAPARLAAVSSVRVNTGRLDALMDAIGELELIHRELLGVRTGGERHERSVAALGRIVGELQATVRAVRMIPLRPTFQKLARLARDLACDLGKKVAVVTHGDDLELDRTVAQGMADPLLHLVRNALDHGLEHPADRLAAGKPETGTLHLTAYPQGHHLVIEVWDDGRGIDADLVYRKAAERGLVPAGPQPPREEILDLIFTPGLSTAETITSVSGRGVGMDIVKRNIEALQGQIEITSELGRGTTFRLKLPHTLAVVDGRVERRARSQDRTDV